MAPGARVLNRQHREERHDEDGHRQRDAPVQLGDLVRLAPPTVTVVYLVVGAPGRLA
jgi:hypothetical protein